jgi:hypothetical protein
MLTKNKHNLFGINVSPFKKQWIATPGLVLSPYHTANNYDASSALLSLAQNLSSPDHSLPPTHVSLSLTTTLMSASTSITTSTSVASISAPSTTLSVTGNRQHDGTIHDANFAKMTDKKGCQKTWINKINSHEKPFKLTDELFIKGLRKFPCPSSP